MTRRALELLCPDTDFPLELRASLLSGKWLTERFMDYGEAVQWVDRHEPEAKAIYILLNPFDPQAAKSAYGATDRAVTKRRWLLIDIDPQRPTEVNATDDELSKAKALAEKLRRYLSSNGWPDPVAALSGNGVHLLYRLDLPNDEESNGLVKSILNYLADTFDTTDAHIDRAVYNASRITKLYGTTTRKGPDTPDRPHRTSSLAFIPEQLEPVILADLQKIARLAKTEEARSKSTARGLYNPEDVLKKVEVFRMFKDNGFFKYQIRCPWVEEHTTNPDSGTILTIGADGAMGFKCQHSHCAHRRWSHVRDKLEIKAIVIDYPLTEAGDAEFFAKENAESVRFDHRRGRWLLFNGQYWAPQDNGQVHRLALAAIRERLAQGSKLEDDARRAQQVKWALLGENRTRQTNLLALAQNYLPIADTGEEWDLHPWLVGVQNGTLDLRTGQLHKGQPEDRITMQVAVPYEPDATCPLWDATLRDIFDGDEELLAYVDRFLGYSLTGDTREEVLLMCWGDGANGKGTIMNTIGWLFGGYADDLPFSAFELQSRSSIPNDIAKIVGKRFVTSSETAETQRLNEARIKALTGRDPITARFLHREFFTFQPVAKFWLATNHKPEVHDDSPGFWRRIHLLPFTQSFVGRENKMLKEDLRKEGPGILARIVRGALDWQRDGLRPPAIVMNATKEYQEESDVLAPFFEECCVRGEGMRVQSNALFTAYVRWANAGRTGRPLNQRAFGLRMRKAFAVEERRQVFYLGIALRDDYVSSEPAI